MYTQEQIDNANRMSIVDYFQSHGYKCEQHGNEYHIRGFGGLNVNADTNSYYQFSEQRGGTGAISCLRDVLGKTFPEAMKELTGESYYQNNTVNSFSKSEMKVVPKKELIMPERDDNFKRVYAYMINTRKITPDVINALVHDHSLYQDKNGNAVFVHKDDKGEAVGAEIQGTLSEKRFKKNIGAGEFVFDKGKPDTAYIFESSIDMMSYMQMHPELDNAKFVSMAGLKPSIVFKMAEQGLKIVSCVDNDDKGQLFNQRLQENGIELTSKLSALKLEKELQQYDNVNYFKSNINGATCYFFASQDDCKKVCDNQKLDGRIFQSSNADNCFTINKECELAGVKDFNEMLVKSSSPVVEKTNSSLSIIMKTAHEKHTQQQNNSDNNVADRSVEHHEFTK